MTYLTEKMRRKEAGLPPPCMEYSSSSLTLTIYFSEVRTRVFAWSRFDSADHCGEELILMFGSHEVVVHGQNLSCIMGYLGGFHIESLRTVPATYRPVDADELVIREFEVRKVQF